MKPFESVRVEQPSFPFRSYYYSKYGLNSC
jgi:hypothetical protein